METEQVARPLTSTEGTKNDIWARKCKLLKRKCEEYEEVNDIIMSRTKKIHCLIERAEKEKRFLIKRLEQFEVLDEVSKNTPLNQDIVSDPDDEKVLLATAVKIRAELDSELARLNGSSTISDESHNLNVAHHSGGSVSPHGTEAMRSTPSYCHVAITPLQSPIASVIVTPTSLVPASIPVIGNTKPKKSKNPRANTQSSNSSEKQKGRGSGSSKRKKADADPNAPKKPSNAFFWFCQDKRASLQEKFRGEGMSGQHDLTKALAKLWSETGTDDKKIYYHKYIADKARYDKEMEEYALMKQQGTPVQPETADSSVNLEL